MHGHPDSHPGRIYHFIMFPSARPVSNLKTQFKHRCRTGAGSPCPLIFLHRGLIRFRRTGNIQVNPGFPFCKSTDKQPCRDAAAGIPAHVLHIRQTALDHLFMFFKERNPHIMLTGPFSRLCKLPVKPVIVCQHRRHTLSKRDCGRTG